MRVTFLKFKHLNLDEKTGLGDCVVDLLLDDSGIFIEGVSVTDRADLGRAVVTIPDSVKFGSPLFEESFKLQIMCALQKMFSDLEVTNKRVASSIDFYASSRITGPLPVTESPKKKDTVN